MSRADLETTNIHLFFGADDFTMREEINKEKEKFSKEFGELNIIDLDFENNVSDEREKMSALKNALLADSLFGSDKLIVLRNFLDGREKKEMAEDNGAEKIILEYLSHPSQSVNLYFLQKGSPDKRKKIYKRLLELRKNNLAEIKEFIVPSGFRLNKWIENRVNLLGGKITSQAVESLILTLGKGLGQKGKGGQMEEVYDLWQVNNEVNKLVNFKNGIEITAEDVNLLVKAKIDLNIFKLIDAIGNRNKKRAINLLCGQMENQANEIYLLTMFVYQFRNLLKIKDLLERGKSVQEISSSAKMHPFVVRKSIEQCRKFSLIELKKIYRKLLDAEIAIKSGKMKPRLVLDLLVISV